MTARLVLVLASVMLVGLASPHASAGDKDDKKEARKDAKEERKDAKEDRKDARDARKDLRDAIQDGGRDSQAAKDAKGALGEARQKLKDSRDERRTAAKTALKAKWGEDLLKKPAVRAELRLHAMRLAKLHHMKRVADAGDKKELGERVEKLLDKEKARHVARMDALKAKNGEETK